MSTTKSKMLVMIFIICQKGWFHASRKWTRVPKANGLDSILTLELNFRGGEINTFDLIIPNTLDSAVDNFCCFLLLSTIWTFRDWLMAYNGLNGSISHRREVDVVLWDLEIFSGGREISNSGRNLICWIGMPESHN